MRVYERCSSPFSPALAFENSRILNLLHVADIRMCVVLCVGSQAHLRGDRFMMLNVWVLVNRILVKYS
jgi:hypothetical protein